MWITSLIHTVLLERLKNSCNVSVLKNLHNSSGICMHCNVFFNCLAAHMLSSETCMLASQESLSNKRVHNEDDEEAMCATSPACNLHVESVAKKSCQHNNNVASISNIEHSFSSSPKIFQWTCVDNIVGDDEAFKKYSSDDHSMNSVLCTRDSDCSDNDMKSSSTEIHVIKVLHQ